MTDQSNARPAKRRYGLLLLIATFVLVNVLIVGRMAQFWYLSEPSRQITIGAETTHLDGPLTEDGYIDYIAAVNLRQSEGVTPWNNAVALLVRAYGPQVIGEGMRDEYFALLGVPPPLLESQYLIGEAEFIRKSGGDRADPKAEQEFFEQCGMLQSRSWTREEFPDVAAMLDKNAAALELIVEASSRERYYSPLVSTAQIPSMYSVLLPVEQQQREAARQLTARAMLKLGEGDAAGAWEDLLACHRLARLTGQSPFIIGALVSIAIDAIAIEADRALVASPLLTAEQARKCLADLKSLRPLPSVADVLDQNERLGLIDVATLVARGQAGSLMDEGPGQRIQPSLTGAIEWNEAFKVINDQVDALVAAMREPDAAARSQKIGEQVQAVQGHDPLVLSLGFRSFLGSREEASQEMGWALVRHFLPACEQAAIAETRAVAREQVLLAGFALAAYQREQGVYPESLAALVPDLLSELPMDPWSGTELSYLRTDDGFVVYSVGEDLTDNGGVPADREAGLIQGDTVLRIGDE